MIHGYHAIFGAYGFWLPNDPRGSWSDFVGKWELVRFGKSTRSLERKPELSAEEKRQIEEAKSELKYPAVQFTDVQIDCIARGFARYVKQTPIAIWACAILPEHVHLVFGRHRLKSEQLVRLLKGSATKQLQTEGLHPLAGYQRPDKRIPSPWSVGKWIQYLDSEQAIEDAIRYVQENPIKEGRPSQDWPFVLPFQGIELGHGWITY